VLLAYGSTGLHTKGYTLARRVLFEVMKLQLNAPLGDTGQTVADALLAVHRSYAAAVMPVISRVHGIAHITGGGIPGNLVRILPAECEAVVETGSWIWPPLFTILQQGGRVAVEEMRDVFNLGVGLVVVLPSAAVDAAQSAARVAGVPTWVLGAVRRGPTGVRFTS
jgi:phosphoribosylformylglycinamidine cyclo-ligase